MKKNLFTLTMMALLVCSCSNGSQESFNLNVIFISLPWKLIRVHYWFYEC